MCVRENVCDSKVLCPVKTKNLYYLAVNITADPRNKLSPLSKENIWKQLIGWKVRTHLNHSPNIES